VDTALVGILAAVLGLMIGSFLTVVVDRVPKHESVARPRSRCPGCGAQVRTRDNVPVISWLLLRGRCRSCGERISVRYPLIEAGTAATFVAVALVYDDLYVASMLAAFSALLIAVSVIDLEHRIIPNRITYPAFPVFAAVIVVGWLLDRPLDPPRAGVGLLAYGGFYFVIAMIAPRGLGMGDVKLAGLIGLVLGSLGLRYVGVAAGAAILAGGLGAIAALALGRGRKAAIPFGPYLAAGALVAIVWGAPIAAWYLDRIT
jgi:leader peptidase (prepilin peptidase) / N-methyltransferase